MASTHEAEPQRTSEDKAFAPGDAELDASGAPSAPRDGEQYFMSGSKLFILIACLCLAIFLIGLDTSIVSTASTLGRPHQEEEFELTYSLGNS